MVLISRSVVLLVTDLLQGAVLQPVIDLLPDPNRCVNLLVEVAFDPEPSRRFPAPSGKNVLMLDHFVSAHQETRQSVRLYFKMYLHIASINSFREKLQNSCIHLKFQSYLLVH